MKVTAIKLIGKEYVDKACSFTVNKEVHVKLLPMYKAEHSPIRTQLFWVEIEDIYTFCSVHLVRHKIGVEHFCRSNREDRNGGNVDIGRKTLISHAMLINAQSLINMSRKRLCMKSHKETRLVMEAIKNAIELVDPDLSKCMIPECQYRGQCHELKSCGDMPNGS